jgi:glycosyltransferase involved in cell wall biosynthesis
MTITKDPCPLAAIEPGAYSLPAITSTEGGLAELVIDGETGYLVPANDVATLADRMMNLIVDKVGRRQMGERAFCQNKRRFDEAIVREQLADLITNASTPLQRAPR